MKYQNATLRHELKYYISQSEYRMIQSRLAPVLRLDENTTDPAGYHIRSLYFDDMHDDAMMEKLIGEQRRDKYRVRIYNLSDARIMMERKSKYDSFISKVSAPLTLEQFNAMMDGNYQPLIETGKPLLTEVFTKRVTALLRPTVVVDYTREAYIYGPGNVRVTFDKDVRAGVSGYDIFSPKLHTSPVVESGQMVLEIKYDDYMPTVVKNLLRPITGNISAISKYVMCRQRLAELKTNSRRVVRPANG